MIRRDPQVARPGTSKDAEREDGMDSRHEVYDRCRVGAQLGELGEHRDREEEQLARPDDKLDKKGAKQR